MPRAGLTPDRLVRAAADLADAEGLAAVTPSALARRLGVRPPSIYAHVDGADDLRQRLLALVLDESADAVAAAIAGRSGADAVTALADAHRGWARAHPGRYEASRIVAAPSSPALVAGRRHSDLMRAALRSYGLAPVDETHVVRLVGSLVHGFLALELAGALDHTEPPPERSWAVALEVLLAGIATRAG